MHLLGAGRQICATAAGSADPAGARGGHAPARRRSPDLRPGPPDLSIRREREEIMHLLALARRRSPDLRHGPPDLPIRRERDEIMHPLALARRRSPDLRHGRRICRSGGSERRSCIAERCLGAAIRLSRGEKRAIMAPVPGRAARNRTSEQSPDRPRGRRLPGSGSLPCRILWAPGRGTGTAPAASPRPGHTWQRGGGMGQRYPGRSACARGADCFPDAGHRPPPGHTAPGETNGGEKRPWPAIARAPGW